MARYEVDPATGEKTLVERTLSQEEAKSPSLPADAVPAEPAKDRRKETRE